MLQYSSALRLVLAHPLVLPVEACPLLASVGRTLAADFAAPESLPRHTYSAMDGFATRRASIQNAGETSPVVLDVVGESRPGKAYDGVRLGAGEAIAIATGGTIPPGVDAIVPVEWTFEEGRNRIGIRRAPAKGMYFRRAGSDVRKGKTLLKRGLTMDPAAVAVVAQFGVDSISVFRRPRVAVLSSGDEIVPLGHPLTGDRIVATNLYYTRQTLEGCGCEVRDFGVAADREGEVRRRLARALEWADLVITLAGVSAGKRDFIAAALETLGGETIFHGVAIKPGKPVLFARVKGKPVIALPGNPLSSACGIEIFVKPYIRASHSRGSALPARMEVPLAERTGRDRQRLSFLFSRVVWTAAGPTVRTPARQESGNLSLLAEADCLAEIPPGDEPIAAGALVRVWPLR